MVTPGLWLCLLPQLVMGSTAWHRRARTSASPRLPSSPQSPSLTRATRPTAVWKAQLTSSGCPRSRRRTSGATHDRTVPWQSAAAALHKLKYPIILTLFWLSRLEMLHLFFTFLPQVFVCFLRISMLPPAGLWMQQMCVWGDISSDVNQSIEGRTACGFHPQARASLSISVDILYASLKTNLMKRPEPTIEEPHVRPIW